MMLFYEEVRNKLKNQSKPNKSYHNQNFINNKKIHFNNYKTNKEYNLNSQNINNIKKSKSFFLSKKFQELQYIPNFDNNIKNINKKQNKKFSYIFQNFHNYPLPEPLPKKIDIRIINNNSNFNTSNINNSTNRYKYDKSIYDDKKILFILINLGLEDLFNKFKDNFITFNDLYFLTKEDFIEMKIPIGPRNRIIHFIQELKKIENNLDFEGLKNFIEKYKKLINEYKPNINENNKNNDEIFKSEDKIDLNNNNFIDNYSQYESEKNDNLSILDKFKNDSQYNNSFFSYNKSYNNYNKSNINLLDNYFNFNYNNKPLNNTKTKFFGENKLRKFLINSENEKNNIFSPTNNNDIPKTKISHNNSYLGPSLGHTNIKNNFYRRNNSQNLNNNKNDIHTYKRSLTFNNNNEYIKDSCFKNSSNLSKYNQYIPKLKNKKINNKKENIKIYRAKSKNNKNYSFHTNYYNLSKNLLNKLDLINKEVEKYQINYERLKNETKRRNRNVIRILSSKSFIFKNTNSIKNNEKKIDYFDNTGFDLNNLNNENERNIEMELNNCNYKINNWNYHKNNTNLVNNNNNNFQ